MTCKKCGEEVDEPVTVQVDGRRYKVCEDCADVLRQEAEVGEAAEGAMQGMMEYKGRR